MGFIKHSGTLSSNGIQTTVQANTVITFQYPVNSLVFINEGTTANLTIKLNNETNSHLVKAGYSLSIEDMEIKKITIIENNSTYSFDALYY